MEVSLQHSAFHLYISGRTEGCSVRACSGGRTVFWTLLVPGQT